MGLVRKSPGPRPAEGTTASRRRMLTAPTPLFSAPTRSSAILVEPRINPVETGASSSGGTPIRIRAGKRRCDSAHEAGTELTVAPCCSIHQDDRISPENNRPLRKPWRPPPTGVSFSLHSPEQTQLIRIKPRLDVARHGQRSVFGSTLGMGANGLSNQRPTRISLAGRVQYQRGDLHRSQPVGPRNERPSSLASISMPDTISIVCDDRLVISCGLKPNRGKPWTTP